jgi:hypothetical protein
MTKLKVKVEKEEDLLELQSMLNRMGLKFQVREDDELANVPNKGSVAMNTGVKKGEASL